MRVDAISELEKASESEPGNWYTYVTTIRLDGEPWLWTRMDKHYIMPWATWVISYTRLN